ncbi:MAG: M15 family metallopeptidase [Clostridia bacterium]|nr:M15 family metallopeptidase [Clostridia bacterium]
MNNSQRPANGNTYKKPAATPAKGKAQKRRKKLRFKPNKEGMIALVTLLLIVALAITILCFTIKAIVSAVSGGPEETDETTTNGQSENIPADAWNKDFVLKPVSNSDVAIGELILVNFEHKYSLTDSISSKLSSLYGADGYLSYYVLNGFDAQIRSDIRKNLKDMIVALVDANPETLGNTKTEDRIILTSVYRSLQKQTELYDTRTSDGLVAKPGHSEHHTGYAVDIQVFTSKQKIVLLREAEQAWMEAHCADFGFIIRYDGSKFETTGILDEPWHYRYVGVAHATYLKESGLCLEEYLELLRKSHNYTEDEPLSFTANEKEYLVYYVPVAEGSSTTSIPVPPEDFGTYTISGDNMNGFIITVEKAA